MSEDALIDVANAADMIVNGYAFTLADENIKVLNLASPTHASLLAIDGSVLETSMDDIELSIVAEYLTRNRELLVA